MSEIQLFYNYCKCATKATTMLHLMYNVHTCNHATRPNFYQPLWDTFATSLTMIPIDTISITTSAPLLKCYYSTMF